MDTVTYSGGTPPAPHLASALEGAGFEVGPFRAVERTLLDTFDGRLHAGGVRLEVRGGAGGPTLILTGGGPAPAQVVVARAPRVAGDLPAGPVRDRLAALLDIRALVPIVGVRARHAEAVRRDATGKAIVGVVLYEEVVTSRPCAAEVIPFEGYPRAVRQAEDLLASVGLVRTEGDVLDLAAAEAGVDLRGFIDSPSVALDPAEPVSAGFRRVLSNLAVTVDANRQGTIDDIDPEFLHDLRIAVRRSRSVLSHAKQVLPSAGRDHFRAELRWLGTITSPLRDLDVYLIEWPGYVAPLDPESVRALAPVVAHIASQRAAEHLALAEHLQSPRYLGLMTAWRAWLDGPKAKTGRKAASAIATKGDRALGPVVVATINGAQDRLLMHGRGIGPASPAEELHELRKDAKRLRYLLECFGGLLPPATRKPFVQRLKMLQDNLGEFQDTEVHTTQLTAMSHELLASSGVTADTLVAMGRLTEVFDRRRRAARAAFADRFAAYDTKQTARAFGEMIKAVR